jgi:hypothetical protein
VTQASLVQLFYAKRPETHQQRLPALAVDMAEQDMRLRLVVRRYGLPEIRLMWSLRLDSDPTIAKVLEQLNNDVPLESDQWGLEDYVVELHDSDGTEFECLHYQSVRSVLKPDDRVL